MKNYRKYLVSAVVIILAVAGVSQLRIQSVSQHNKEQYQVASDQSKSALSETEQGEDTDQKETDRVAQTAVPEDKEASKKDVKTKVSKAKADKTKIGDQKKDNVSKKKKTEDKSDTTTSAANKKDTSSSRSVQKASKNKKNSASISDSKSSKSKKDKEQNNRNTDNKTQNSTASSEEKEDDSAYIRCEVTIDCSVLLSNMDALQKNVRKYVPKDGMLLQKLSVKVKEGASAYDALVTACKAKKIAYDAEYSKMYNGVYVKGIGYLYEKMAGDMSGWLYQVDGKLPNVGASRYIMRDGDTLNWTYTCSGRVGS